MKLEVGMYVRWKRFDYSPRYLIGKIIKKDICWIYLDKTYDNSGFITETNILKSSFNLIDLIEVGDYVNGMKVSNIKEDRLYTLNDYDGYESCFARAEAEDDEEIKEVLTKQQYENNVYKIKE
jgi:hypothetical protein